MFGNSGVDLIYPKAEKLYWDCAVFYENNFKSKNIFIILSFYFKIVII